MSARIKFSTHSVTLDFKGLFSLSRISLNHDSSLIEFFSTELAKTRFHFESLETTFHTFAEIDSIPHGRIADGWKIVKDAIMNFRTSDPDYDVLKTKLLESSISPTEVNSILDTTRRVIDTSRTSLTANVNTGVRLEAKLGTLGELAAFLYSVELEADCVFHKLVPDNQNVPRHGMDLLTIKFNKEEDDVVQFWEAKATIENFSGQCHEIVEWFTGKDSFNKISMVIEAAKIDWASRYEKSKFHRASRALSRFQANLSNFLYIGFILHDLAESPTDSNIAIFDKINVGKGNKQLVTMSTGGLGKLAEEVYMKACRT